MLKLSNLIIIVLVVGLFTFCATTYKIGKQYSTEHVTKIIIGKTSENDIITFFGDPWKTGILNGNVVFTYCYEEIVFHHNDSVDKNGNTLIIEFDENKLVVNYYFNIPGKELNLLGLMMHKRNMKKQEEEQVAWQNQMATNPSK
jgi:ribosomal protein S17E